MRTAIRRAVDRRAGSPTYGEWTLATEVAMCSSGWRRSSAPASRWPFVIPTHYGLDIIPASTAGLRLSAPPRAGSRPPGMLPERGAAASTLLEERRAELLGNALEFRVGHLAERARLDLETQQRLARSEQRADAARYPLSATRRPAALVRAMLQARLRVFFGALFVLFVCACGDDGLPMVDVDAHPPAAVCVPDEQRAYECKLVCFDPLSWCPGEEGGADCYDECLRFETGLHYCPPRSSTRRPRRRRFVDRRRASSTLLWWWRSARALVDGFVWRRYLPHSPLPPRAVAAPPPGDAHAACGVPCPVCSTCLWCGDCECGDALLTPRRAVVVTPPPGELLWRPVVGRA